MSSGTEVKCAVKRLPELGVYGVSSAQLATMMIPLRSESLSVNPEFDKDDALLGTAAQSDAELVSYNGTGAISTEAWFHGLEYLFLAAMGFENPSVYTGVFDSGSGGSPAPDSTDTAFYHLFELDDRLDVMAWEASERIVSSGSDPDPEYWTAADQKMRVVDIGVYKTYPTDQVHRFRSCKIDGLSLTANKEGVALDWQVIPRHRDYNSMNLTNWVAPTGGKATFTGLRVYIGGQTSAWVHTGSEYAVMEATLKLENSLKPDWVSGSTSEYAIEALRNGIRKVSGEIKLARYDATASTLQALLEAETPLHMVIELVGEEIVSGHYNRIRFIMPTIRILGSNFPTPGPQIIQGSFTFEAIKPTAAVSAYAWLNSMVGDVDRKKGNELLVQVCNTQEACFSRDRQAAGVTLP